MDSWTEPVASEPAVDDPAESEPEAVVDAVAVELPPEPPPTPVAPPPPAPPPPPPVSSPARNRMPSRAAAEPVGVASPAGVPVGATSLGDSAQPYAGGHRPQPAIPSWQEPLNELVAERPEVVVGAAFVGGLLAALILRRLGS